LRLSLSQLIRVRQVTPFSRCTWRRPDCFVVIGGYPSKKLPDLFFLLQISL
jgi:hypothetical protein